MTLTPALKSDQSTAKTGRVLEDAVHARDLESILLRSRNRGWSHIFGTVIIMMGVLLGLGLLLAVHRRDVSAP